MSLIGKLVRYGVEVIVTPRPKGAAKGPAERLLQTAGQKIDAFGVKIAGSTYTGAKKTILRLGGAKGGPVGTPKVTYSSKQGATKAAYLNLTEDGKLLKAQALSDLPAGWQRLYKIDWSQSVDEIAAITGYSPSIIKAGKAAYAAEGLHTITTTLTASQIAGLDLEEDLSWVPGYEKAMQEIATNRAREVTQNPDGSWSVAGDEGEIAPYQHGLVREPGGTQNILFGGSKPVAGEGPGYIGREHTGIGIAGDVALAGAAVAGVAGLSPIFWAEGLTYGATALVDWSNLDQKVLGYETEPVGLTDLSVSVGKTLGETGLESKAGESDLTYQEKQATVVAEAEERGGSIGDYAHEAQEASSLGGATGWAIGGLAGTTIWGGKQLSKLID